jgi:hypothetical protein
MVFAVILIERSVAPRLPKPVAVAPRRGKRAVGNVSKADYSKCDYESMRGDNEISVHLAYGLYQCFDPHTGARTQVLMMYGYNKKTQRPERILPLSIEHDEKHMWLMQYTYKSRAEAVADGELTHGVHMYGQFWSDVTPEMHQRGYIR